MALTVIVFAGLDGYFLWQRRLLRRLYRSVVAGVVPFLVIDVAPYRAECRYWPAVWSRTVVATYAPLEAVLLVAGAL